MHHGFCLHLDRSEPVSREVRVQIIDTPGEWGRLATRPSSRRY
jgi:hypothetical protein